MAIQQKYRCCGSTNRTMDRTRALEWVGFWLACIRCGTVKSEKLDDMLLIRPAPIIALHFPFYGNFGWLRSPIMGHLFNLLTTGIVCGCLPKFSGLPRLSSWSFSFRAALQVLRSSAPGGYLIFHRGRFYREWCPVISYTSLGLAFQAESRYSFLWLPSSSHSD